MGISKIDKMHSLSKNQQIIFDLIDKSPEPMKAYSILFNVQKKGIKAPLQVYRALDKLVEIGKIHKIESRNAFIACQNSSCQVAKATAFSICEMCEKSRQSVGRTGSSQMDYEPNAKYDESEIEHPPDTTSDDEDVQAEVDMNVVMLDNGDFVEIQGT